MKILKNILIVGFVALIAVSCEIEDATNLNGPTTDSVSEDLSRAELRQTMAGVLADMRVQLATQTDGQAVAGREYWRFQSSDPRWTADLLTGTLDDNTFYTTNPYAARYATVKDINLILEGLENSTAGFSAEEIAATRGFANTIKAHELLMVLNQQFQNGIRVDVNDPDNLGPFVSYEEGLTAVFEMLTTASADLANAGSEFPFVIPSGFDGIEGASGVPDIPEDAIVSPADFLTFTNALMARVEAYRGNYASVITLLSNSFMDMSGDLRTGAYFTFSLTGADIANPLFFALNSTVANARIAHPSFIVDAEANDNRLSKVVFREVLNDATGMVEANPLTSDNLTGTHDVFIYDSNVASVPILRNEELILLLAEANHITNPTAAVAAIDIIRTAAGLPAYSGGTTPADLVTEILNQRRYSLYAEGGHRWIDLRRFDRLSDLEPLDRGGDATFDRFPTPANENRN
ncbi:RagB/SusD family nutrient uptake outer membrane protein [Aquimarina sp. RZ0]|uniref:RagB/SusD family nutrient uptake outer membrane protein n=1 Tax=Aquimarina sp. RZ0 TaxID=2607730 RepID=UPI0011F0B2BB|nr:RagB/SusD family nutrient uptake outer membrane protein [Aquimarina sp. RZ0]KAA1245135.1 RagB/SusD family nutrient uptake outer membrane protein [Aquimarina sp. RZ0]